MNHRLILTEGQSEFLRELGSYFAVVAPGSYPDANGRAVLHLVECDKASAEAACRVALGQTEAKKQKPQAR